jgi:isopentenyl-diphosphate delta-isomerase
MQHDNQEFVILVDEHDRETGRMEKMEAHRQGVLHRAFSVFIFNSAGEWLLQQRAISKYHSGGLWTNSCCSHPRPGETVADAAKRRLGEEMGIAVPLTHRFQFIYKAALDSDLTEHELDHVFTGQFDGTPVLSPEEAMDWKWMKAADIRAAIAANPGHFTVWFREVFEQVSHL